MRAQLPLGYIFLEDTSPLTTPVVKDRGSKTKL